MGHFPANGDDDDGLRIRGIYWGLLHCDKVKAASVKVVPICSNTELGLNNHHNDDDDDDDEEDDEYKWWWWWGLQGQDCSCKVIAISEIHMKFTWNSHGR